MQCLCPVWCVCVCLRVVCGADVDVMMKNAYTLAGLRYAEVGWMMRVSLRSRARVCRLCSGTLGLRECVRVFGTVSLSLARSVADLLDEFFFLGFCGGHSTGIVMDL